MRSVLAVSAWFVIVVFAAGTAYAADPPLARARTLYNAADYDGAIAAAAMARAQANTADAARLVGDGARSRRAKLAARAPRAARRADRRAHGRRAPPRSGKRARELLARGRGSRLGRSRHRVGCRGRRMGPRDARPGVDA